MVCVDMEPSELVLLIYSGEVAMSWGVLAKFMTANLVILKGKLWEWDQLSHPLVCSIIFFKTACDLSRVFAVASNVQSSTKLVDSSDLPLLY